jgi:hypothetical protein
VTDYLPDGIEPADGDNPDKKDTEWEWRHEDGTTFRVTTAPTKADWRHTVVYLWWSSPSGRRADLPVPERQWVEIASAEAADALITGLGWVMAGLGFAQVA